MKIILFADAITYPSKEGVSYHIVSQLFALSRQRDIDPILLMCDRGSLKFEQLEAFPWKTILVPESMYYDYTSIEVLLDSLQPDVVQSYNPYHSRLITARYSYRRKVPLVMEHHDLESELTHHLLISREVSQRAISIQAEVARVASLNRTLSEHDREVLVKALPEVTATFYNLPTIIEDQFVSQTHDAHDSSQILFIGNGAYPPNQEAIHYISTVLAPSLPQFHFHLVGRMTETVKNTSNLTSYGMLDDLSELTRKVAYGIAPLIHGSGLKIKVLTYLSAGLPVIGTELAFRGFGTSDVLVQTPIEAFGNTLERHARNYAPFLAGNARKLFLDDYGEKAVIEQLLEKYRTLKYKEPSLEDVLHPIKRDDAYLVWLKEFRATERPPVERPCFIHF